MTDEAQCSVADAVEHERQLWEAFKTAGSAKAREGLFDAYQGFARDVARRQIRGRKSGDIEFPDLCQLAYAGLLEAIDGFDPGRGTPFKGYAVRRITGSILDGLAKTSEVREQISFRNRVRNERVRSLSPQDVESMPLGDAMQALVEVAVGLAIGFMLEDTGAYLAEDRDRRISAYESLAWKDNLGRVMAQISDLPERERSIMRLHYVEGVNFDKIAGLLGVSKGRVSQLHRTAIMTIKHRLLEAGAGNARGLA